MYSIILKALECVDVGKPYNFAVGDIKAAAKHLRYYAGYADKLCGKTIPVDGDFFAYTRLEPVGVCGAILPVRNTYLYKKYSIMVKFNIVLSFQWNFPLMLLCWKLGPALAAGCTIVFKPAEQTPLTALHFCSLVKEVRFFLEVQDER